MSAEELSALAAALPPGVLLLIRPESSSLAASGQEPEEREEGEEGQEKVLEGLPAKLKKNEAGDLMGIPQREVDRAVKAGLLTIIGQKETGKDAGATMLDGSEAMAYLERRRRVREDLEPVPAGWPDKTPGRRAVR